jgi:hypothetical protein
MSKETTLADLLDVLQEHTLAMKAHTAALDRAVGGATPAKAERPIEKDAVHEEKAERRGPGRPPRADKAEKAEKVKDFPTEAERKQRMKDFLTAGDDIFDTDKERDAEYDRRMEAAFDPVFKKANVTEPKDLPAEFWPEIAANMAAYEESFKAPKKEERRRRDV